MCSLYLHFATRKYYFCDLSLEPFWSLFQVPTLPSVCFFSTDRIALAFRCPFSLFGQCGQWVPELSYLQWLSGWLDEDTEKLSISQWWSLETGKSRTGEQERLLGPLLVKEHRGIVCREMHGDREEGQKEEVLWLFMNYLHTLPSSSERFSQPHPTTYWLLMVSKSPFV